MNVNRPLGTRERGVALITSLLLMLIITILALSMFRSFGTQEKIAGNLREKERAVHAAESAQQFAESWLMTGNNAAVGNTTCVTNVILSANANQGQICAPGQQLIGTALYTIPWNNGTQYIPPGMGELNVWVGAATPSNSTWVTGATADTQSYAFPPMFYISDLGAAADAQGEAYQIDALGYGSTTNTVAIVESTYEVSLGVINRGGL